LLGLPLGFTIGKETLGGTQVATGAAKGFERRGVYWYHADEAIGFHNPFQVLGWACPVGLKDQTLPRFIQSHSLPLIALVV
jgi:hypothetical protein